jgi:hypothetical protein
MAPLAPEIPTTSFIFLSSSEGLFGVGARIA